MWDKAGEGASGSGSCPRAGGWEMPPSLPIAAPCQPGKHSAGLGLPDRTPHPSRAGPRDRRQQSELKMVVVTAKSVRARKGLGVEGGHKEQEQQVGRMDNDVLWPKQKRTMSKSKHVITLTFCCI